MLLKKTKVGQESNCGLIIKPFQGPWVLRPNEQVSPLRRKWIVIPLNDVKICDDYIKIYAYTNAHYEVSTTVTIVEPAMIILLGSSDSGPLSYAVNFRTEPIAFNSANLYTAERGLYLPNDMTLANKHIAISSFYNIYIRYGEINNVKPFFEIPNMVWKIEKSSGIKSGQFIL